jgi:hypothetical protein
MRVGFTGSLLTLFVAIRFCSAQPAYVEVKVPVGVRSETMFVRYALDDDFGGWVQPHPDVSSYFVTIRRDAPAARFRALLYAPGCAIQTADLPTLGTVIPRYSFVCEPLPMISLIGTVAKSGRFNGHDIDLNIRYVARWAQSVLGLGGGMVTDIPVGVARQALAGGTFRLSLPDFSEDPLAGLDHPGEFRILAKDRSSGRIVAQLVPATPSLRSRMGGLQIRKGYPETVEFAFCLAQGPRLQDANGFAIRPDGSDSVCEH